MTDTAGLRVAAGYLHSAVSLGLIADEVQLTAADYWPNDVADALQHLGLADRYSPTTMAGVLTHLHPQQVNGLVNSVKGTVLEMHVADSINHGDAMGLPGTPDHAVLAPTLNQPGWDVETFHAGHHVGYLQMKETADPAVLAHHLARYPEFPDVATSHEAVAAAHAGGRDVTHLHGVVSDSAMTDHVHGALDHLTTAHAVHEVVPEIALGMILVAGAMRLRAGHAPGETGRWVAEQAATAGVANLAGLVAQTATGTVLLRPFAAIGSRFAISRARTGHVAAEHFKQVRSQLRRLSRRSRGLGYMPWSPVRP